MLKQLMGLLLSASLLTGCADYGNPSIANKTTISEIQKGKSTKQDVLSRFGEPQTVADTDGLERWVYVNVSSQVKPETMIPIVGLFVGGATSKANTLSFDFDPQGIVIGINRSNVNSDFNYMQGLRSH